MHYARLKSTVFSSRLRALWSVISWSDVGSEFHAAGPANAKLRSSNLRRVAGCSYRRPLAERSRERDAMLEVDVTSSDMYDGLHPVWMRCIRVHSLNVTRCSMGPGHLSLPQDCFRPSPVRPGAPKQSSEDLYSNTAISFNINGHIELFKFSSTYRVFSDVG